MAQEIERKFLVTGEFKSLAFAQSRIVQGYISSARGRTVRVRIRDNKGYLTIKGASNASGTSRYEWEKELPLSEAEELMKLCEPGIIDKKGGFEVSLNWQDKIGKVGYRVGVNYSYWDERVTRHSSSDSDNRPSDASPVFLCRSQLHPGAAGTLRTFPEVYPKRKRR